VIRLKRIDAVSQGISVGILAGLALFVATNWLLVKGGETIGPNLGLLREYLIGYRVTFVGSVIGAIEVFVIGFIAGYIAALLYNWFANRRLASDAHHSAVEQSCSASLRRTAEDDADDPSGEWSIPATSKTL